MEPDLGHKEGSQKHKQPLAKTHGYWLLSEAMVDSGRPTLLSFLLLVHQIIGCAQIALFRAVVPSVVVPKSAVTVNCRKCKISGQA